MGFPAELRFLPEAFIHPLLSCITLASAWLSCTSRQSLFKLTDYYVTVMYMLLCILYAKAMTLSPASSRNATVGEIVNLMSVDVQKCQDICHFINFMWSSPIIIVIAIYFLWQILGPSTLAGVIFMLVILPLNSMLLAKKIRDLQVSLLHMFVFFGGGEFLCLLFVIISVILSRSYQVCVHQFLWWFCGCIAVWSHRC